MVSIPLDSAFFKANVAELKNPFPFIAEH